MYIHTYSSPWHTDFEKEYTGRTPPNFFICQGEKTIIIGIKREVNPIETYVGSMKAVNELAHELKKNYGTKVLASSPTQC